MSEADLLSHEERQRALHPKPPPYRLSARFVRLTDIRGNIQRVCLSDVSRWWPERQGLVVVVAGEPVLFANATWSDRLLCAAFYELTPADLGV